MGPGRMGTMSPGFLPSGQAVSLAQAPECVPLRVVVQAQGGAGALLFVGYDAGALNATSNNTSPNGFQLAMGQREVFYVSPGQVLSAIASTSGVTVSFAVSEALDHLGDA